MMDSEQQFWLGVWKIAGATVVALATVFAVSCQATNYHIRRAIEAGEDPMAVNCALSTSPHNDCVLAFDRSAQ